MTARGRFTGVEMVCWSGTAGAVGAACEEAGTQGSDVVRVWLGGGGLGPSGWLHRPTVPDDRPSRPGPRHHRGERQLDAGLWSA